MGGGRLLAEVLLYNFCLGQANKLEYNVFLAK